MARYLLHALAPCLMLPLLAVAPASGQMNTADDEPTVDTFRCGYVQRLERLLEHGDGGMDGPGDPQPETPLTDVLHTKIDIEVNPTARTVNGTVTITARSNDNGLSAFVVYLNPTGGAMGVSAVGGAGVGFAHVADKVTITLDRTYNAGEEFTVTIAYGGSPDDGIYWGSHGTPSVAIVATLSEPFSARGWWAGKDVLNDKCTFDIWVTVADHLIAVSNGILRGTDVLSGNRKRYRWEEINPMIPYLASLAIADYDLYSRTYTHLGANTPMDFYMLPENNTATWRSRADTYVTMTQVFSDLYGQYPFANEKGGMAHTPTVGGTYMEHQTIPSMPSFNTLWINAHELAHQWWGDHVTCQTWGDIWLNEGFASFSEALWEQYKPGGGWTGYHNRMGQRRPSNTDVKVYVTNVNSVGSIFSGTAVYNKGSWVVHMLRHVLGDAVFFPALGDYRAAHGGDSATTAEFAATVSATAGYDVTFFTNQWVMNAGSPDYEYAWLPAQAGGRNYLLLKITQTQGGRGYGPITMPIDVEVNTGAGSRRYVVWNTGAVESFAIPLPAPATAVALDPDDWILTHSVTETTAASIAPVCQGDMNGDGDVNGGDIGLFVAAVLDRSVGPLGWRRADMDYSGVADEADVPAFIDAVLGLATCP